MGEMERRGYSPFREDLRSQPLQHAGRDGLDVFSQPALAQSGRAGPRATARRQRQEYRFLRHLCRRVGDQHCAAGARHRIFLVDGHGGRAALSLSVVSSILRGLPNLRLVLARSLLCALAVGTECRNGAVSYVRACPRLARQCCAVRRLLGLVHFRAPLSPVHLHFCYACLYRDIHRSHPGAATAPRRAGLEDGGAASVPGLFFRVTSPRLLSRHHRHRRPHTRLSHCLGPSSVPRGLAAINFDSSALLRPAPAPVHAAKVEHGWRSPRLPGRPWPSSHVAATSAPLPAP